MWFKNLRVYRLTQDWAIDQSELEEKLEEHRFQPCGKQDTFRLGWTTAAGKLSDQLSHTASGNILLAIQKQEKILPSAVVNETLEEKVQQIEEAESRQLYRKERESLKEEIIFELLPRAFTRSKTVHAYIDTTNHLIVLNTPSAQRADEFLNLLRESIGSLPAVPLSSRDEPVKMMTHWVTELDIPKPFALGGECELQDPLNNQNKIRARNQELTNGELNVHLEAGKLVNQLMVNWNESISGLICEDLAIKRLKFEDVLTEQTGESDGDDAAEFDANFTLMAMEINKFLRDLTSAFGGVETDS
jgi:recombination associated protein RdgC